MIFNDISYGFVFNHDCCGAHIFELINTRLELNIIKCIYSIDGGNLIGKCTFLLI